jgi:hypothetical protein
MTSPVRLLAGLSRPVRSRVTELAAEALTDRDLVRVASQRGHAKGATMHIESVTIRNILGFGSDRTGIDRDPALTARIGNNGSAKTAACQALQRVSGIRTEERSVRVDDVHIPADENVDAAVADRDQLRALVSPSRSTQR